MIIRRVGGLNHNLTEGQIVGVVGVGPYPFVANHSRTNTVEIERF